MVGSIVSLDATLRKSGLRQPQEAKVDGNLFLKSRERKTKNKPFETERHHLTSRSGPAPNKSGTASVPKCSSLELAKCGFSERKVEKVSGLHLWSVLNTNSN